MKKLYTLVSILFLYAISFNCSAQVSTNGASGMLTAYGSLAGALTDLNAIGTVSANLVITLEGDETAPVGGYLITATGTPSFSITFNGDGFILTAATQAVGSTNDAVVKIIGGDYITFNNFVIQENSANTVLTPVASNTMTEFGIALYGSTTTNGAQNNTIQNNSISLNSSYVTSLGILSTCTFVSTAPTAAGVAPAAQTAAAGGENSNNKYYGNTISNVAFGIMLVTPPATATFKETGNDIGGTSSATGNAISYGNTTGTIGVAYQSAQSIAAFLGGITITNSLGVNIRFNSVTTTPTFTLATSGIILGFSPATPANSTFTNTVSDNIITVNSSATAGTAYGIEFGYGNGATSVATLTAANNSITINQTSTAATNTIISGIRTPYASSAVNLTGNAVTINQTHAAVGVTLSSPLNGIIAAGAAFTIGAATITGNNITINQSHQTTTAASITSPVIGISASASTSTITTANINFNNITVKQAVTSSGTYGGGAVTFISVAGPAVGSQAVFPTLNINSNNINTLGSTILSTGTVAGILHDFTNVTTLSIASNIINFDRTSVGTIWGIYSSAYTAAAASSSTVTGNGITFTGSMAGAPTEILGINEREGNITMVKNITIDTVNINLPNVTGGNHFGITFQTGIPVALGTTNGSVATSFVTITTGGTPVIGVQVLGGASTGILTNINANTFNLSSSNNAPTITGVNVNAGNRSKVFSNNFNSLAAPNAATGNPVIRAVFFQAGGSTSGNPNEVSNNTVSNVFTFAGSGAATVDGIIVNAASNFTNVFKNKIYGLTASTSGAATIVTGIKVNSPGTANGITNINNNYIGFDNSANPNAANTDGVRGIAILAPSVTSTLNVFHNTIYLAAVPSAIVTNYGTTGLFHTFNTTAAVSSLVLRNNIIVNISTAKGTGRTVAFRRSAATNLNNYNAASNNNLFYCGTPSALNLIFNDGTNFLQTLSSYQSLATLSPRDNASVTENPPFLSFLGSSSTYLHINTAVGTVVESGGGTGTGITDDYDGDVRCPSGLCPGGAPITKPDIGADEFNGTCPVPVAPTTLILTGGPTYTGNFTGATPSPTGGYFVVRTSVNTAPTPANGTNYIIGAAVPGGGGTAIAIVYTSTTTFTNTPGGGTWYYWVFSYNVGCGTSPNYSSSTASATTTACVAPAIPTVLNLTPNSSSRIDGSFTGSGASGYLVVRYPFGSAVTAPTNTNYYTAGSALGLGTVVYSGSSTSFSSTGMTGSTQYTFYVYGYNEGCFGTPAYSGSLNNSATTLPCLAAGTYSVGPTGYFNSIGQAITALTTCYTFAPSNPIIGAFIFEFEPTYNSSVETYPLVIPPVNGTSVANTITFRPQAVATGISITSSNTAGTLLFQGLTAAQTPNYYIFDGRPGGAGITKELTIQNTNVGSSYAVQLENGANNITIQYCKIRSAHNGTSGGGGTINFGSSNSTAGNSNNTIINNDIFNAAGGTPTNAIYSSGISTAPNNSNVISTNSIYDFFNAGYTTAGINLAAYSNTWTINSNSFYQTAGRTFTSTTATFNAILSAATTVDGLTIQDNFIGGTAASAGGGLLTLGGNGILRAIQLTTGTTATSVQNNTIKSIAFTSSNSSASQSLISLVGGVINVGTVTGNTLGSQVTTNNTTISLSDNTAGVNFAAISASSSAATDIFQIKNNTIGGIGILGTSTSANIQGINFSGATGTYTITANTIGSAVANSFTNSLNTTITGIYGASSNATPTQIVSGNTISNVSATNTGTNSYANGISANNLGKYSIGDAVNGGNTIFNLSSAGSNVINYNATGIVNSATTTGQKIYGNTIYNVNSTSASADVGVVGIYYNGPTGAGNTVESNNIHSLNIVSTTTTSVITGIQAQGGAASFYNNMVRLGITNTGASISTGYGIYGITENAGTNTFYMNSVYVGGTGVVSGSDSYAFFGANTGQDIRNNIFWNARSNTSTTLPSHYAVVLTSNSGTINYNDILSTGASGSILGFYSASSLTLAAWRIATGQEANSYSSLPGFISPTTATPNLHINTAVNTVVESGGTPVGPATDIDAQTRATLTPDDLGADAFIAVTAPVKIDAGITALSSPAAGFGCFSNSETVRDTIKNYSGTLLDFSLTPITLTVNVTGATVTSFTTTISTGTLAAGASLGVTFPGTLNMTFVGTYTFTCTFTIGNAGVDKDMTNDVFTSTRNTGALAIGTASSNPINFCGVASGTPTLSLNSVSGGSIQWYQSAVSNVGPWTAVGTNSLSYTPVAPISATYYYYATVSCGASSVSSNVVTVSISSPQLLSTSGNQNSCGPSSFTFTGSVNAGSILRWYDASTGALAGSGSPFVTPVLSSTTTYNAKAESTTGVPASASFGTSTTVNTTTSFPAPYTNWYGGTKHQMLILASELSAAGATSGNITSVTFNVQSVGSTFTGSLTGFTIYMGSTASTALTTTFLPVPTLVYSAASQAIPSSGLVTHTFSTPFNWDGSSNILIQTSYSNGNFGGSTDNVQMYFSPTSFASTNYYRADLQTPATILAAATGNGTNLVTPTANRPNMILGYTAACSSPSTAVTATVNPAPTAISIAATTGSLVGSTADTIAICTDSAKLVVTGGTTTQNNSVTVSSGTINVFIPDVAATSASLGVTMPLGATIDSIRIKMNGTHTFDGDLNVNLQSPNGQIVNLMNRRGGSGADFTNMQISSNTADASFATGSAPFTGLFRADLATPTTTPAITTAVFSNLFVVGTAASQTWILRIQDMAAVDVGNLQDWSISIFYKEPIPVPYAWTPITGLFTNPSGPSTAYVANQNLGTVYAKPTVTTDYVVTATLGTCTKTDTIRIKPYTISSAASSLNVTPTTLCKGSSITLTQTGGILGSGASWKWYSDAGFTTLVGTSIAADASLTIPLTVTTTFYLRSEGGTAPCAANVASPGSVTATIDLVNTSWLGANNDWNDVLNWCSGAVPTSTTNVTIPGSLTNYPIITTATVTAFANNVIIAAGASITTTGTGALDIKGTFTNNGNLLNWGEVKLTGSSAQTFPGTTGTIDAMTRLTINNAAGVTIDRNLLIRQAITPTLGTVNLNNVYITLRSVKDTTARIGAVGSSFSYTGTGNFVVERYFPGRRSWRLITAPVVASGARTIFSSWQAGGNNGISGNATYVTGPLANPAVNGLDVSPMNNFSLKRFDYTNSSFPGIGNTLTTGLPAFPAGSSASYLTDNTGYFMFVRGDRTPANSVPFDPYTIGNSTVLRDTGNVKTGAFTYTCNPGTGLNIYTLVGNPYASPIDFQSLGKSNVANKFQVWDPNLNIVGGFVVWNAGSITPVPPPPSEGPASGTTKVTNSIIQSKQAFIVERAAAGAATLTFGEAAKVSDIGDSSLFRPAPLPAGSLAINLYGLKINGSNYLVDGAQVQFNDEYAMGSDYMDALKLTNINETFSIKNGANYFIQERRPFLNHADTLFFSFNRTRQIKYRFNVMIADIMRQRNRIAYLEDKYLHTATPLNMHGNTWVDFEVNSNAASAVSDRFFITFKRVTRINHIKANVIYTDVAVNWAVEDASVIDTYEIERSADGKAFEKVGEISAAENKDVLNTYDFTDLGVEAGSYYYRVKAVSSGYAAFDYTDIVKVKVVKAKSELYVYPNPVTENNIHLSMSAISPEGRYSIRLINGSGQVVAVQQLQHVKVSSTELITYPSYLAGGTYQLEITAPDKKKTMIKIIIQKQ